MTLLDPEERNLYTDALRPPPGMSFDAGVGTTYSLDLDTLLTVPLHLLLYSGGEGEEELLEGGVALLRALKSVSSRLTIYCERGRILEPNASRRLYGLLEEIAVPVDPPSDRGSFHPKLWLLRFRNPEQGERRLRLLILSRNLTRDLSWDLMLRLEGEPGDEPDPNNAPLADLLEELGGGPTRGGRAPDAESTGDHSSKAESSTQRPDLLDDLRRAEWELPAGYNRLEFHVTGPERGGWLPDKSDCLFAVSPFCSSAALRELAGTTREARGLLSRPEALADLEEESLDPFQDVFELDEMAASTNGEEPAEVDEASGTTPTGLHAKLYLAEQEDRLHLHLGSANATNAALLGGRNVEVMAELAGPTGKVGGIEEALDPEDGLRAILREWIPPDERPQTDPEKEQARERLEHTRRRLSGSDLRLECQKENGTWRLAVVAEQEVDVEGVESLQAWPVTVDRDRAVELSRLAPGQSVPLPGTDLTSLTTFIAFRIVDGQTDEKVTFVLNLPVQKLPREERDAALVRGVIRDRESFLRYLLMLLGEIDEDSVLGDGSGEWRTLLSGYGAGDDELPLLEELTRAYCRQPHRLEEVGELVADLQQLAHRTDDDAELAEVIPEEFLALWSTFEEALGETEVSER